MPSGVYKKSEEHLNIFLKNGEKTRFKKGISSWNKGKICSKEWVDKNRQAKIGNKNNLGKHWKIKEEKRKNMSRGVGKNHHNWLNGKSLYDFNFNKELKNLIRKRDNLICKICGEKGFDVHHIDYNKKNCDPKNLMTLCRSCHMRTNFNRRYWIKYFNKIKIICSS